MLRLGLGLGLMHQQKRRTARNWTLNVEHRDTAVGLMALSLHEPITIKSTGGVFLDYGTSDTDFETQTVTITPGIDATLGNTTGLRIRSTGHGTITFVGEKKIAGLCNNARIADNPISIFYNFETGGSHATIPLIKATSLPTNMFKMRMIQATSWAITADITPNPLTFLFLSATDGAITGVMSDMLLTFLFLSDTCEGVTGNLTDKQNLNPMYLFNTLNKITIGGTNPLALTVTNASGVQLFGNSAATLVEYRDLLKYASARAWTAGRPFTITNEPSMADLDQGGLWGTFDVTPAVPSDEAIAYKDLFRETPTGKGVVMTINGLTAPDEVSGDGTGFPAGFGDWLWDRP